LKQACFKGFFRQFRAWHEDYRSISLIDEVYFQRGTTIWSTMEGSLLKTISPKKFMEPSTFSCNRLACEAWLNYAN